MNNEPPPTVEKPTRDIMIAALEAVYPDIKVTAEAFEGWCLYEGGERINNRLTRFHDLELDAIYEGYSKLPPASQAPAEREEVDGVCFNGHHHGLHTQQPDCRKWFVRDPALRPPAVEAGSLEERGKTTLLGYTKPELLEQVDRLFEIAIPGEDIPWQTLLVGQREPTEKEIKYAQTLVAESVPPTPVPAAQGEPVIVYRCAGNCEGHEIVSCIWKMLGDPSYTELNGRSIYDLIAEIQSKAASSSRSTAHAQKVEE